MEKCADGKLLGIIPMCQSCGGGKLRFDRKTGVYSCPGYMEDTDFIRCGIKFDFEEVKRESWIDWWDISYYADKQLTEPIKNIFGLYIWWC